MTGKNVPWSWWLNLNEFRKTAPIRLQNDERELGAAKRATSAAASHVTCKAQCLGGLAAKKKATEVFTYTVRKTNTYLYEQTSTELRFFFPVLFNLIKIIIARIYGTHTHYHFTGMFSKLYM